MTIVHIIMFNFCVESHYSHKVKFAYYNCGFLGFGNDDCFLEIRVGSLISFVFLGFIDGDFSFGVIILFFTCLLILFLMYNL